MTITIVHIRNKLRIKFKLKIMNFWTKFTQKEYFWSKRKTMTITIECYTPISLDNKFQLQETILIFLSKTAKMNTTIKFCIFESLWVSNFTLKKRFWVFGPNLPKKGISSRKWRRREKIKIDSLSRNLVAFSKWWWHLVNGAAIEFCT